MQYESIGDKDQTLLPEDYLHEIEPYLSDIQIIIKLKESRDFIQQCQSILYLLMILIKFE